jgi:hypothetical protein
MHGDNVPITVLVDDVPHDEADNCLSISIEPVVVNHEDKLLGRKRNRLDQQLRGWKATVVFEHTDNVLFKAWMRVQKAREDRTTIPEIAVCPTFEMRDGTSETWSLTPCVVTPKKEVGGAEDVSKLTWEVMAEEYEQTL